MAIAQRCMMDVVDRNTSQPVQTKQVTKPRPHLPFICKHRIEIINIAALPRPPRPPRTKDQITREEQFCEISSLSAFVLKISFWALLVAGCWIMFQAYLFKEPRHDCGPFNFTQKLSAL